LEEYKTENEQEKGEIIKKFDNEIAYLKDFISVSLKQTSDKFLADSKDARK
jgi:hypothetical protein